MPAHKVGQGGIGRRTGTLAAACAQHAELAHGVLELLLERGRDAVRVRACCCRVAPVLLLQAVAQLAPNSPMMSFSFFFSAAVMAVRVRSLLLPAPQPCAPEQAPSVHAANPCRDSTAALQPP